MASAEPESVANMFESHPSLSASLEDFEPNERPSAFRYPSHRSGFARSDTSEPSAAESSNEAAWSPPPPDRSNGATGSGWYRHQPYLDQSAKFRSSVRSSPSRTGSRGLGDDDPTLPANIPLPKGSVSPEKEKLSTPARSVGFKEEASPGKSRSPENETGDEMALSSPTLNNYIRFSLRADMQHRTEPFETLISWLQTLRASFLYSRLSTATTLTTLLLSIVLLRLLTRAPLDTPAPDLVKIAGLTRSFEPLIYYSENGINHVADLQETGIAVWDLGESVRAANMSGSATIVSQLDQLAGSLKALGTELTRFFAAVDGDIDNILLVMDWARRELSALTASPAPSLLGAGLANVHGLLSRSGLLTDARSGAPTAAGNVLSALLGQNQEARSRATLTRTFVHLLGTLEASINDEIVHTTKLFALFAMIDGQFANLQRTTVRELDTQEQAEGELLGSLWQRVMGGNAGRLRKFEKNRQLLMSVRQRTVSNKHLIVDHDRKLKALQQNLEVLRQRLVKPVIHDVEGSSAGIDEQIKGLESTYEFLRKVREEQKGRVLEKLYGSSVGRDRAEIESS